MEPIKKISNASKLLLMICVTLTIFTLSVIIAPENTKDTIETASELNNKKIGWGIKRNNNNEQPEIGEANKKLIEKYNGIAIGNPDIKNIYLTFDLGYEAGYTKNILKVLKEKNVSATFFITAHYLNTAPELVEQMINDGHIIGNHTVNHKSMPDLSDKEIKEELMTLNQTISEKYNYEMKYMRPPMGEFSERTLRIIENLGFKAVMWSFAYVDWEENNQPSKNDAISKIYSNLHNGEVMLLHGTSKTNSEIMGEIIDGVRERGYNFKSLDEFN